MKITKNLLGPFVSIVTVLKPSPDRNHHTYFAYQKKKKNSKEKKIITVLLLNNQFVLLLKQESDSLLNMVFGQELNLITKKNKEIVKKFW